MNILTPQESLNAHLAPWRTYDRTWFDNFRSNSFGGFGCARGDGDDALCVETDATPIMRERTQVLIRRKFVGKQKPMDYGLADEDEDVRRDGGGSFEEDNH